MVQPPAPAEGRINIGGARARVSEEEPLRIWGTADNHGMGRGGQGDVAIFLRVITLGMCQYLSPKEKARAS